MDKILDKDVEGKKVLMRTDLNLPVKDGIPMKNLRLQKYAESVKKLSERGAKIVLLAHQGRPGDKDFISLEKHVEILEDYLDEEIRFINSFMGDGLSETVEKMEKGDVALVENIRMMSEELMNEEVEKHSQDIFVEHMAKEFDFYVNDAFSVAHRPHGSMMGFIGHLPSSAGPLMVDEVQNCKTARDGLDSPTLVLGGAKPSDLGKMIERMKERAEKVLLGGIPGEISLKIQGNNMEKKYGWIKEKGLNKGEEELERLLDEEPELFETPLDVVTEDGVKKVSELEGDEMIWDIGPETASRYSKIIASSESVVMKGPMGAFENGYIEGTRKVIEAVADCDGFSLLGGGHTSTVLEDVDVSFDSFSHVSIAGGAFVRFMSGGDLPVLDALNISY